MAQTITKQQREDLLKRYRGRVEQAKKRMQDDGLHVLWKRLVDLYKGKHFDSMGMSEEDRIAVNIAFATVNVIAPSVGVSYPQIVCYARDAHEQDQASIVETMVNYWWRHHEFQSELNLALRDWLMIGHGWMKVGWRYVEEAKSVTDAALTATKNSAENTDDMVPADPNEPTANDPQSSSTEDPYEVVEDRPFLERVSPYDILVDPEAKTLAQAKWIAQKIVKPMAEVKQDKRYRQAARANLQADGKLEYSTDDDRSNDDIKRVTIYEFYDLTLGTMCVFSALGDGMLLDPLPQPYDFGHPFRMLRNYEVPDEFYPMGELEALEPLQLELDKTRSMMMNHRKKYNRKFLYDPTMFDAAGRTALSSDVDNTMVPVAFPKGPLEQAVVPLQQVAVEPQLYQYSSDILANLDRVSGVAEFQQGGQDQNIRRTATEASMIQDAATARASQKLAQVELFIAKTAYAIVALAQQYMTQDQVVRIIGKNSHPLWIPFSCEDIQGEYDFEVEAGSTQPKNESFRKQQALQLLQAMTPYAQAGLINVQALLLYALRFGFEVKDPMSFMAAATPPQEGGSEQPKAPKQSLIETMNYKDAPPDIQRQIEQAAGLHPSQMGGSSPAEQAMAKVVPAMQGQQVQQGNAQQQVQAQLAAQQAQAAEGHAKRQHEAHMKGADQQHEKEMAAIQALVSSQQAEQGHQNELEQGAQQAALAPQPANGTGSQ